MTFMPVCRLTCAPVLISRLPTPLKPLKALSESVTAPAMYPPSRMLPAVTATRVWLVTMSCSPPRSSTSWLSSNGAKSSSWSSLGSASETADR